MLVPKHTSEYITWFLFNPISGLDKILITGGAGFIGTHLVKELLSKYDLTVVDNLSNKKSYSSPQMLKENHISFFEEDIVNKEKITEIIRDCRPDSCVHLAPKLAFPNP